MTIEEREKDFTIKVNREINFSYELRKEFIEYWTEKNKSGTKMRFELERTWDLKRRLHRWAGNKFGGKMIGSENKPVKQPEMALKPISKEIAELDKILEVYRKHPTSVPFSSLGAFYPYMKQEKLLRPFYPQEVENLKRVYNNDTEKCRCACVLETLNWYTNKGWTFQLTMETRLKLSQ